MTPRILVVDDERAIQLALRGVLRREGYEVDVAGSGSEALARLRDSSFDLVLTAREILCRARGDDACRFIMAPPSRIDACIEKYRRDHPAPEDKK